MRKFTNNEITVGEYILRYTYKSCKLKTDKNQYDQMIFQQKAGTRGMLERFYINGRLKITVLYLEGMVSWDTDDRPFTDAIVLASEDIVENYLELK